MRNYANLTIWVPLWQYWKVQFFGAKLVLRYDPRVHHRVSNGPRIMTCLQLLVLIVVLIAVVVLIQQMLTNSAGYTEENTAPKAADRSTGQPRVTRLATPTQPQSGFETLAQILLLGVAGVVLYKYIESGGLERLLRRIGHLTIEVNGRRTTISDAVQDEAFVRSLLLETVEEKLTSDSGSPSQNSNLDNEAAANEIVTMLRAGVKRKMKEKGIA